MNKFFSGLLGAIVLGGAPAVNAATLDGDTVACGIVSTTSWSCSSPTAVVGTGSEFDLALGGTALFSADIGNSSVRLDFTFSGSLNTFNGETVTFSGLDFAPNSVIVGISNFATDANTGVAATDVSFGDDFVSFNFNHTTWITGEYVSFDLVTSAVSAVPLPAGLPLLLAGLGALGFVRRRAGRKTA